MSMGSEWFCRLSQQQLHTAATALYQAILIETAHIKRSVDRETILQGLQRIGELLATHRCLLVRLGELELQDAIDNHLQHERINQKTV